MGLLSLIRGIGRDREGLAFFKSRAGGKGKVLFFMPPIESSWQPSLGLAILCTRLVKAGYAALAVDYSYFRAPDMSRVLAAYQPDIVAMSVFSMNLSVSREMLQRAAALRPGVRIIAGGPHVTLATDDASFPRGLTGVVTQVKGEADDEIAGIVGAVLGGAAPAVVQCAPFAMSNYVWPDFDLVLAGHELETYPMQLSRGCPFGCIFCNIKRLAGRKFRKRDIGDCSDEIAHALRKYPNLRYVKVVDDAPNCDAKRLEDFIGDYLARGFQARARLEIMQMRADKLTLRTCRLLKDARAPAICIGVESANEVVLRSVAKGESLEDMERACSYVKACGIPLVLCFVIGLPGATRESDEESLAFARKMQPAHCYWNLAQPMPETQMLRYFQEHGTVYADNVGDRSTLEVAGCFADTPEYPKIERVRMQLKAQAATNEIADPAAFLRKAGELGIEREIGEALGATRPVLDKSLPRRW